MNRRAILVYCTWLIALCAANAACLFVIDAGHPALALYLYGTVMLVFGGWLQVRGP